MLTTKVTKQTLGACQACLQDFVVHADRNGTWRMVLHGYERPGVGYIEGKCSGVNVEPFEISCEFTKKWREHLVTVKLPAFNQNLAELESGAKKIFTASHYDRRSGKHIKQFVVEGATNNPAPWDKQEPNWTQLRQSAIARQKTLIAQLEADIAWLGERISSWVFAPEKLRAGYARLPLSRQGAAEAAATQKRRAELAQKKADKAARATARRQKAESDVAALVVEIRSALSQEGAKDALLAAKGSWFGDFNMSQLADKYAHWTELLARRGLITVQTNLTWDLKAVIAGQRFDWMRNAESVRADLREVAKALKKELAGLGFKAKKAVA